MENEKIMVVLPESKMRTPVNHPYLQVGDLYGFFVRCDSEKVTDEKEMKEAFEEKCRREPFFITDIEEIISVMARNKMVWLQNPEKYLKLLDIAKDGKVFVLATEKGDGMTAVFQPGALKAAAKEIGGSYYAISPSRESFFLFQADPDKVDADLTQMGMRQVPQWTDGIYFYDTEADTFNRIN